MWSTDVGCTVYVGPHAELEYLYLLIHATLVDVNAISGVGDTATVTSFDTGENWRRGHYCS